MESGVEADTPCAVVSHAGRVNEQKCFLPLQDLPFAGGVAAPAILIVGEVARCHPRDTAAVSELLQAASTLLNEDAGAGRIQPQRFP